MRSNTCSPCSAARATPASSAPRATSSTSWSRSSTRKKNETILDPACGTAGFLISAWKHILKANTNDQGNGDQLTPDERATPGQQHQRLRHLARHGAPVAGQPVPARLHRPAHLSNTTRSPAKRRWNEYADVILANPPFMSPKGGIKPHKRFSVQAKRSEVLFVDYMAEHLTPTGRAAIIVPEGIIFQSQTAYKALRKMLVETSLVAVVSLPAGVFQSLLRREDLHPDSRQARRPGRATASPFSKWRTTASTSVRNAAPSTRTTCRRSRLNSPTTLRRCAPAHRSDPPAHLRADRGEGKDRREWRLQPERGAVSGGRSARSPPFRCGVSVSQRTHHRQLRQP